MKLAFELDVPDGAVDRQLELELVQAAKEQTVLKLYSQKRVTVGQAIEMLEIPKVQFLDLLRATGIGFQVDLDEEDFRMLRDLRDRQVSPSR